jgi:hypothetical protein
MGRVSQAARCGPCMAKCTPLKNNLQLLDTIPHLSPSLLMFLSISPCQFVLSALRRIMQAGRERDRGRVEDARDILSV